MKRKRDFARIAFVSAAGFLLLIGSFLTGIWSVETKNAYYQVVLDSREVLTDIANPAGREKLRLGYAFQHLQPSRVDGAGVTTGADLTDGRMVLLIGFFDGENQARLIRRDGSLVQKWDLVYTHHFPAGKPRACDFNTPGQDDVHGAYLTPKGELVFNYEYCGTVKLDRCGKELWSVPLGTHHSLTPAVGGGYWALARGVWTTGMMKDTMPVLKDRFRPFSDSRSTPFFQEDLIVRLDAETGKVVFSKSIPQIFYDSGLEAVITENIHFSSTDDPLDPELVHSNKLEELTPGMAAAYPMFKAGDLLISLRLKNLVAVIDRDTMKVKWWRVGPWIRQHDPEFRADGWISVFDNNTYYSTYNRYDQVRADTTEHSEILAANPATGATRVIYGDKPGQHFLSVIRGQHEYVSNGDLMVADFDGGRAFEVDPSGRKVWQYVNRYDDRYVGEMTHAIPVDPDYLQVPMGPCGTK